MQEPEPQDAEDTAVTQIVIRHLESHADYRACVALQYETWGKDFRDAVPPSILLVSQKLGGVAAGAFDAAGRMIGFVYGLTGVEDGQVVHWSDMLAVRPEARNSGVARRLKEFQRRAVASVGGRVIYWTYDPLVARNAHLNFNVFGVDVARYVRDMYGSTTGSDLHRGIGTDRLIVAWPVDDDPLALRREVIAAARESPLFKHAPIVGDIEHATPHQLGSASRIRIAIPSDLASVQQRDAKTAAAWRGANRAAFEAAFEAGFRVDGFDSTSAPERGFYLLSHQ